MSPIPRYPTGGQYRDAVYNTDLCFKDPALKGGTVNTDNLGMPKLISGNFASVFTVRSRSSTQRWGVKCFTRFVDHQEVRYQRISEALRPVKKPWRVEFDYLSEGLMCEGHWYPALKMEWVEAVELIPFVEKNLRDPSRLADLAAKFARMVEDLATLGIAHGDLQHGNLLVTSAGELKLIDYDGMYVPSLAKMGACEIGHANYQSPARTSSTWGPYLDNFSAWVIYASLVALIIEPALWTLLRDDGDEALLFKKDDFGDQRASRAFQFLSQSPVSDLQRLGAEIKMLWAPDVRTIPPLDPRVLPAPSIQSSVTAVPLPAGGSSAPAAPPVPDWVIQAQAGVQGAPPTHQGTAWITGHLPTLPLVVFQPSRLAVRLLAGFVIAAVAASVSVAALQRLPDTMVGLIAAISAVLFLAVSIALFRRTSESREKHSKLRTLRERKAGASGSAREVARIERARLDLDGREQKELARITKQAEKAKTSEQKELADIDRRLQAKIRSLEKQRQRLTSSEASETGKALLSLQQHHVRSYLSSQLIGSAKIPGIGQALVRSLAAEGIRSAADFSGIRYQTGPRGGQQLFLSTRHGLVHPSGIGDKKAQSLENWRRSTEYAAMASQPTSLPATQLQAIRMKYTQQRQILADQEQAARAQAAHEHRQTTAKWAATHAGFSGEVTNTRQRLAQERAQTDTQLTAARKKAEAAVWQRELADREVAAYRKVSYGRYLVGIIRS